VKSGTLGLPFIFWAYALKPVILKLGRTLGRSFPLHKEVKIENFAGNSK
jgi:hypothetical protein